MGETRSIEEGEEEVPLAVATASTTDAPQVALSMETLKSVKKDITVQYNGLDQEDFDDRYGRIAPGHFTLRDTMQKMCDNCECTGLCVANFVRRHVPVVDMFATYQFKQYILGDILAGISLAIMQVPQGMGYALLANLPPIIGLYTSFFPVLMYFIFGRSRHVSMGTMALSSLVISSTISKVLPHFIANNNLEASINGTMTNETEGVDFENDLDNPIVQEKVKVAMSVSLMSGVILILMSFLRLGKLATYISDPFMGGYISGCNIQVLTHQIKHMLGITVGNHTGPFSFFYLIWDICLNLKNTNIATLVISIIATLILFLVKKFINERYAKKLKVPIPIDIIVVIMATLISHYCLFEEKFGVKIIKKVPQGLPQPAVPPAHYMGTYILDAFILGLVNYVLMFIMIKMFSVKYNYPYDPNQEMFATGIAGLFGAFFQSMAGSTSPPRCILGDSAGGKTQLAHFISAALVMLTLLLLAPLIQSLPLCILACLIIVSCIPLFVYYKACVLYWRTSKYDLLVWTVSLLATMIAGVDYGILIGVGFSMVMIVVRTQRPYVTTIGMAVADNYLLDSRKYSEKCGVFKTIKVFRFEAPLYFATIDLFKHSLYDVTFTPANVTDREPKPLEANGDVMGALEPLNQETGNTEFHRRRSFHRQKSNREPQRDSYRSSESEKEKKEKTIKCCPRRAHDHREGELIENADMTGRQPLKQKKHHHYPVVQAVIIDCTSIPFIDTSGGQALVDINKKYEDVYVSFALADVCETARDTLSRIAECKDLLIYPSVYDAIVSLKEAGLPDGVEIREDGPQVHHVPEVIPEIDESDIDVPVESSEVAANEDVFVEEADETTNMTQA